MFIWDRSPKLVADLHVHTVSSGHAYSTLQEYVAEAKKIGLKAFAMTDHGPAMPGASHWYHFSNLGMVPKIIAGIRIYKGIEVNIVNDQGQLDLPESEFKHLEIVIVAMHPRVGYENQGEEKNTEVLIKALSHYPQINIIAHPENPKYPVNVEATVAAAKARGVLIEINNSSAFSRPGSQDQSLAFAKEVKKQDWKVAIGSDSHISTMLGRFTNALKLVKEAGLTEDQIVNTSLEKIEKYLLKR